MIYTMKAMEQNNTPTIIEEDINKLVIDYFNKLYYMMIEEQFYNYRIVPITTDYVIEFLKNMPEKRKEQEKRRNEQMLLQKQSQ